MTPLHIVASGAVTAAGLTAAQTFAAIRAGLSGFSTELLSDPFGAEQTVARIPTHWSLRSDPGAWLINMAARAIRAAMEEAVQVGAEPERTALLLTPPESGRGHPCYDHIAPADFTARVIEAAALVFHHRSRAFDGGAAAGIAALDHAVELLAGGEVGHVILAGVDSLINPADLGRLAGANRLIGPENAKGLVPGEAAAAVCLSSRSAGEPVCRLLSTGFAREADSATGERFSQGRAMVEALRLAAGGDGSAEGHVDFVLSNSNGERYAQMEGMIARARFYRTRRERLPTVYPAMSIGDVGAAGAALCLAVARDAFRQGYAPGRVVMAEIASEGGLRAAAILRGEAPRAAA